MSRSSGSRGRSRLRSDRHSEKAASASPAATITPPAQPSSGSLRVAARSSLTAFHGYPTRSRAWASSGGAGSGKSSRGSMRSSADWSEPRQVAVELELADLGLVVEPLVALVADEPLEHVLAQR